MQKPIYPPAELLQHIANNPSVEDFVNSFVHVRNDVKGYLREAGREFADFRNILDLGCGLGRFLYAFQPEVSADQRLYGCDVYEPCAIWCKENIDFASIAHTAIEPPLPFGDGQFDFVYALSVFTHLRLDLQFKWAWEIYRVLEPGGIFFVTIHGSRFVPLLFASHFDLASSRELYTIADSGLFAYLSSSGATTDEGQVQVAAAQSLDFVKEQFSAFDFLRVFPHSNLAGEQDLYIVQKPLHGRVIATPLHQEVQENQNVQEVPPPPMHQESLPTAGNWVWKSSVARDENEPPFVLRFRLDGQRRLRVYPRVTTAAFCSLDVQVEMHSENGLLARQQVPINNTRVFGKTHYAKVEMEVPPCQGDVEVRLRCVARHAAASLPAEVQEVEWAFPNCV